MKFTPEVVAALTVLRNAAENDFERHRLDVLERDLTSPPQVEIIDENHQKFDGFIYRRCKDGHYTRCSLIHRDVWQYFKSELPSGYHVHHVDENKDNNNFSNFQILTSSEHRALHNKSSKQIEYVCQFFGKTFMSNKTDNSSVQFCSKKCYNKWAHREKTEARTCTICGKKFIISKYSHTQTCSLSCRSQLILKNAVTPPIEKTCPACGKTFFTRSQKRKYCSPTCGKTAKIKTPVEIVCPVCGKSFIQNRKHTDHLCCSRSCGLKLSWQRKRNNNN